MINCVQKRPAEIQSLVLWKLIGHDIPGPLPAARVIAHQYSSITFIPATTTSALIKNINFLLSSSSVCASLKMCDLQLRKSRNVCTCIGTKLTRFLVSYLFAIYLTTLVVPQTTHFHLIALFVNVDCKK
jgi:hypothetical protein